MNVYTCTSFRGHWPVGVSAIVVASDVEEAAQLLSADLASQGLAQEITADRLEILDTNSPGVLVLNDGDY